MDSQNRCAITSLLNDAPSSTNTSLKSSTNSSEISAISESSILSPLSDNSINDIDIKKEHLEHIEHIENIEDIENTKNFIKKEAKIGGKNKIDKNTKPEKIDCKWINCTRSFTDPQKLYDHLCDFHVGRKSNKNLSLSCKWDNCKTITSKRDHLTSHLRVHIPLKPYSCNDCEKKFKRPQDLKKHKKTHINSEIKKRQKLFYEKLSLLTPIQKSEFIKSNFNFFENLDDNTNNNNSNYNHNYQHIIKKENTLIYNNNNNINHNNSNAININNFNNNSQINYNAPPQYMNFQQNQSYTHLMFVPEKQHYQMIYPYQQFPQQQIIHFQPMMISNSNSSSHTSISNLNSISIPQPQQQLPHQQYNLQLPPTQSSHIQPPQHQYQQYTPIPAPAPATQQSYIHNAYPTHNANKFYQSI